MVSLRVGVVGTGYAARTRAELLAADERSQLMAIASRSPERTIELSQGLGVDGAASWQALVERNDIDVVFISTINRDHGTIARAALQSQKHVVVEYPLALDLGEAEDLIRLAKNQNKLLHVEHIELLSGIHTAIQEALPAVGTPFYVRSSNIAPQHPAPQKWTYVQSEFGFPLMGAVSRLQRLIHLFGEVELVNCQTQYRLLDEGSDAYSACLCSAQLTFRSGLVADVVYAKGDAFWVAERSLIIQGTDAAIQMEGEQGNLIQADQTTPLTVGSRRGLFAKDTQAVLDHLISGLNLYVTPDQSLYALRVADAARRSAMTGQTIGISPSLYFD